MSSTLPDSVSVGIACVCLSFGLLWNYRNHAIGAVKPPPGVPTLPAWPLIGSTLLVINQYERINDMMLEWWEKLKQTYAITIPFSPTMYITQDPKNVEFILKTDFESFVKGEMFHDVTKDVLGNGIFNTDGDFWRGQRKTASHIFNVKNFKDFVGRVFKDEADILVEVLDKKAESGEVVDMQDLFFRFTLDSFGKIGFNTDMNCLTTPGQVPFAAAFDAAQNVLHWRFFTPTWKLEESLFSHGRVMSKNVNTIRTFAREIVAKRRADPNAASYGDILSLFMNSKNAMYDDDETLVDVVLNFIIAGRDTTAQALSWTVWLVSQHPEVEAELVKEITETLGDEVVPTYEQVKNMKYAKAVFLEALRLYPSVPKEMKYTVRDTTLPDGTFIKEGSAVAWSPYAMGRLESIWGPTAKKFDPSRWLEMTTQPSPYAYPVFNAGPRVCLGRNMAELEGVFVLVSLMRRFKVKVVTKNEDVTWSNSLTLPMRGPLNCLVQKRSL